jgi:hypothetical protein
LIARRALRVLGLTLRSFLKRACMCIESVAFEKWSAFILLSFVVGLIGPS